MVLDRSAYSNLDEQVSFSCVFVHYSKNWLRRVAVQKTTWNNRGLCGNIVLSMGHEKLDSLPWATLISVSHTILVLFAESKTH